MSLRAGEEPPAFYHLSNTAVTLTRRSPASQVKRGLKINFRLISISLVVCFLLSRHCTRCDTTIRQVEYSSLNLDNFIMKISFLLIPSLIRKQAVFGRTLYQVLLRAVVKNIGTSPYLILPNLVKAHTPSKNYSATLTILWFQHLELLGYHHL